MKKVLIGLMFLGGVVFANNTDWFYSSSSNKNMMHDNLTDNNKYNLQQVEKIRKLQKKIDSRVLKNTLNESAESYGETFKKNEKRFGKEYIKIKNK